MSSDKRDFYKKIAENSLKNINNKKRSKTNRKIKNNNYISRNGMINLGKKENSKKRGLFFRQCIICILIICIFYYLSNINSPMTNQFIEKTKKLINSEININKPTRIFKGNAKEYDVIIDKEIIEDMEREIENKKIYKN